MKSAVPTWLERQHLLYPSDRSNLEGDARLSEIGRACQEGGYLQDALEFFKRAKDRKGLQGIRSLAIEEGDAFLLTAAENALGEAASPDDWNKLGYRAFESGKYRFARTAFERSQNEIMLAKIRATLGEEAPADPEAGAPGSHDHPHGT